MKQGKKPDPTMIHPIVGYDKEIYVKPTIKNPNIIVGDFTYIADSEFEGEWNNGHKIPKNRRSC
jgi:virginiamycin A acetyltransferase